MNQKAMEEITKARSLLVLDHEFFGLLVMRMKFREEPLVPTCSTDGTVILYNPDFILSLTMPERVGTIAHEGMHPAMGDLWRFEGKDHMVANMAADYVNNDILIEAGFTLPKGALHNPAYKGMSKEEVYNILIKQMDSSPKPSGRGPKGPGQKSGSKGQPQPGDGQGQGPSESYADPGGCGSFFRPQHLSPAEAKEMEAEWKSAVAAAAQMSQGKLPASLTRIINDEILDPPLPWHVLLRDFVEHCARNDYNWTRPNRRYLPQGIVLPSLISDELPTIVIGNDTSGSIDPFDQRFKSDKNFRHAILDRFAAEASAILGSYQTHIIVVHCDARVHSVEEYDTQDLPIKLRPGGGGGTDFRPVFNYIRENGITPACLVYLTDLYGTFPSDEPPYPVMWVSVTRDKKAPFGDTIELSLP